MTKIAPLIGNEATERSFLKRFGDLCADPLFHVRKVSWIIDPFQRDDENHEFIT